MVGKWRMRLFWAALLAIATALGVRSYLRSLQATEPIVTAAREIPARTQITADMLTIVQVSREDRQRLANDAFQSIDEVVGRNARRRIEAGEILHKRPADFTEPGTIQPGGQPGEGALAAFIPSNARAVTLKLDPQAVLGQQVRPGDRVDVIFTSKSDSTGGVYSSLILQQVQVINIEKPSADEPDKEVLVTLLVTPEQAVDVALAKRTGSVDLALNPPDSGAPVSPRTTSPLQFIGQGALPPGKAQPVQAPPSPPEAAKPGVR